MPLLLGIDTGGTFTDAVLFDEARGVVAKAKSLTTHSDLAEGVGAAVASVLAEAGEPADTIALVSLSTTLATNAMVEGQGGRVGLVFIGFDPSDAERPDLKAALNGDPVIVVAGGHDAFGEERAPLDLAALAAEVRRHAPALSAFAVTARFAALNPAHEIAARDLLHREADLPVTCGHELSVRLDGPKRALTSILNARLVHLLDALIAATEDRLHALGILAPLMVVRGDGALVTARIARAKPIETIFSGPAASVIGGAFLAGLEDAVVADIGGTTTDVAILRGGRPRLDPDGAVIGGLRTMVEAIAIRTVGLGGDSEVGLRSEGVDTALTLGPRRALPVSLLAVDEPRLVHETLDRQRLSDVPHELDGRFVVPLVAGGDGLPELERELLSRLAGRPAASDRLLAGRREANALQRLIARRLVIASAFTPSDAAHVAGHYAAWDLSAAQKAAELLARRRTSLGRPLAANGPALAALVLETLTQRSSELVLDCALVEDGFRSGLATHPLALAAMARSSRVAAFSLGLSLPLVGLGASARTYYGRIAERLGASSLVPEHADVANAIGAVVGSVSIVAQVRVLQPVEGLFRVLGGGLTKDLTDVGAASGPRRGHSEGGGGGECPGGRSRVRRVLGGTSGGQGRDRGARDLRPGDSDGAGVRTATLEPVTGAAAAGPCPGPGRAVPPQGFELTPQTVATHSSVRRHAEGASHLKGKKRHGSSESPSVPAGYEPGRPGPRSRNPPRIRAGQGAHHRDLAAEPVLSILRSHAKAALGRS